MFTATVVSLTFLALLLFGEKFVMLPTWARLTLGAALIVVVMITASIDAYIKELEDRW